jgi:hypothetical protein
MGGIRLTCCSCGVDFLHSVEEQELFRSRGFLNPDGTPTQPRRCVPCRRLARQQKRWTDGQRAYEGEYQGRR